MDYQTMTAPCGLDCFNCDLYLAQEDQDARIRLEQVARQLDLPVSSFFCRGCRLHDGQIPIHKVLFGQDHFCAAYECAKAKGAQFCGDCEEFPCDHLHPLADKADTLPHNTKVFNCCLIRKMGVSKWGASKAAEVRKNYFTRPWSLK